ncbi:MAG TPA: proprotein convertase P-domain-containing protein [Verrucomicrobiae bacterium]|nr:proprotein convertase P-domain-containing protein [Verrucomicrobiae bacterium]
MQSASAQVLFTTTNDFGGWSSASGWTNLPSVLQDSDGGFINGIGNNNAAGATGTVGSLQMTWVNGGAYNYPTFAGANSNVIAALQQPGKLLTYDYTTPTNFGGNYFALGFVVNCQGRFDQLFPSSQTSLGGGWTRAVLDWSTEAAALVTQQVVNGGGFSYFAIGLIWNSNYNPTNVPFYVDNFVMRNPPPTPTSLFTTTNDFAGWTTGDGFTNVAPTTSVSLDSGPSANTNGLGNLIDPGAVGTSGSLIMPWVSGAFSTATESPNLSGNAAVISNLLQAQSLTYYFTTPTNYGGNYYQLGMTVNYEGGYDYLGPSVSLISNNIYQATIDWSAEAPKLINQYALNTNSFSYFYIGFFYNSNYNPTGDVIYVDNISAIVPPAQPYIVASSALASESCSPTNGVLDPGETVTLNVALQNLGTANASNVVATLQATGGVTSPSGAQSYGTLLPGAPAITNSFTFTVGSTCGSTLIASLLIQSNSTYLVTKSFGYPVGILGPAVTNTYSSGGISVAIPDNDPAGITNSITVSSTGVVSKVVVRVRMNHTYDGDVTMSLIHPDGTTVNLIASDPGNSSQDFGTGATDCTGTFTVFDDAASTPIAAGSGPYAGSYIPRQSLAALNGKAVEGNWKLVVSDNEAGDVGTLYCWQVQIAYQSYACCSGGGPTDPFTTWQFAYFGNTNSASSLPNADPDGDGMINSNEFVAGFNPTNSTAFLKVISIVNSGQDVRVTYLGANGDGVLSPGPKTNVLESAAGTSNGSYSNNFVSTGRTNVLTGGSGVGIVTNMIDSGGATNRPSRYYRVRVLTP